MGRGLGGVGWCYVCVSCDSLCRWQVQVSVLGRFLRILGAPSVQSCRTLWISASYRVFVYGRYRESRLVCVWLADLDLSRHYPLL